jgi:hypothetical protein
VEDTFTIQDLFSGISLDYIFLYTNQKDYTYSDTIHFIETYRKFISEKRINNPCAAVKMNSSTAMIFTVMAMWSLKITPVLLNTRLTR